MLKSYANAHRSRRTTLARLAEKFATTLYMEPMSDGGYHLKCANLLEVSWVLQNKWSPVAPFHHRMKFDLEYMDESYIKIITQTHRQLNDPSIETDERTFLLTKIISTCLEAQGPTQELYESMSSDPETAQSLRKRRTTLDKEPEIPVMKKKKDSEVMAPPKSLPKKAKPKGKENINTATDAKPKKVDKEKKTNKVVDVEKNVALKKNLTEPIISVNIDKNKDKPKIEKAKTDPVINKKVSNNLNTKDNVVFKKSMNNDINGTENSNKDKSKGISAKGKENPTKIPKDKQDDKEIKQKSENLTKIAKNNTNIAKQVKEKVTAKENKKNANENDTEKVSNTKNKINAVKTANAKDHDVKKLDNVVAKVKSGTKTINKVNSAKLVKESAAVKDTEQANVNKPKSIATIKKVNPIKPVKESNKENNQVNKDKVVVAKNVEKRESVASLKRKSNLVDKVIDNINVAAAKKPKLSKPGPVNQVNNKNVNKEQISNKPNIVKSSNQSKPKIVNGSFKSPRTSYNVKIIKSSAEKNSKIPQKTSINQDKMTKNPMKISPLKLPAKFKIPANVNKQKSVQKTTNIPRLLKKTSPS